MNCVFRKIISEYDSNYSAASLDEAYCDLTEYLKIRESVDVSKRTFPKKIVIFYQLVSESF